MDFEEEKETKKILDLLSDLKPCNLNEKGKEELIYEIDNEKGNEYLNETETLYNINTIKNSPEYILSKWNIIVQNLINMDDFYFYLKENKIAKKKKKNKKENKENINIINNNLNNSNLSNISIISDASNISNENNSNISNSHSFSNTNQNEGNNDILKNDLNEFKLNYIRKGLGVFENEGMDGEAFKKYSKSTLILMLLLMKINYYTFMNPKNIDFIKIFNIYKALFNEKENIKEIKEETFEIDLLVNLFKKTDLKSLIKKYPSHFYFTEQLKLENIKEEKLNIISEIVHDIFKNGITRLKQENKYIYLIKILNEIRKNQNLPIFNDENIKVELNALNIEDYTKESIFILITNGSFFTFKFTIDILSEIFKKQDESDNLDVKIFINKKISDLNNTNNFIKIEKDFEAEDLINRIYEIYNIFKNLRKENIKHCLMYIGEENSKKNEESILSFKKYISENNNNQKNLDDILFKTQIEKIIKELKPIQNNFFEILVNYGNIIINKLSHKKNIITDLFKSFSLQKHDLITIKLFINDKDRKNKEIDKVLQNKKYYIIIEYFYDDKPKYFNKSLSSQVDFIYFINKSGNYSQDFLIELINLKIPNILIINKDKDVYNQIEKSIKKNLINNNNFLKNKYFKNIKKYHKEYFNTSEILNYNNLSQKIKDELGVDIEPENIKNLIDFNLDDKERETYINNILKNIQNVYDFMNLKFDDSKRNELIEMNKIKFLSLIENIKASSFYDYVYYFFLPELKYELSRKIYLTTNNNDY